jgi:ABC-type transport system involved in multi-copper enzyme maturation permease subunit
MATATVHTRSARLAAWLPWAALAAWAVGAVGIWSVSQRRGWAPGELILAGCVWLAVLALAARDTVRGMFGPVFWYEIVRLGRRRLTFILRLLYVLAVMALLSILYLSWLEDVGYFTRGGMDRVPYERLSGFATMFFQVFVSVQFWVVVLLTPAYVAGTIADEKERKTLEFLLATDLRNREIVFGKLAARVANLLMFVLAGLPVVAFLQLFGGIDPDMLLASVAATIITVVGLSAMSVAFSVALRRPRDAVALAYLAVLVYYAASFLAAMYVFVLQVTLARTGASPWELYGYQIDPLELLDAVKVATDAFASGNILYVIVTMSIPRGVGTGFGPDVIGTNLFRYAAFWGVATALFLGYAVWRLRVVALAQSHGAPKKLRERAAKLRPAVGNDPMLWKEAFVEGGIKGGCLGRLIGLAVAGLVFVVPAVIVWQFFIDPPSYYVGRGNSWRWKEFAEAMNGWARGSTGVIGGLLMLAAAVRGAGAISGERDRDTWISLIATPLTAWEMLRGKWLGCLLGLRRGYFLLLLVWATALAVGAMDPPMVVPTVLYLLVCVSAFAWIGILCSITARTTLIATVRAIMISLFAAGGYWLFLGLCCGLPLSIMFRSPDLRPIEYVMNLILGCTPPFAVGWMPLMDYTRSDMGIFSLEERYSLGPFSPMCGFVLWFGLNWLLGLWCWRAFSRATNRARDTLAGKLPRPRRPRPLPPGELPVARPVRPRKGQEPEEPIIFE